jgi:oligopeptide transport system ATP-binding protein
MSDALLTVEHLTTQFSIRSGKMFGKALKLTAVDDVSFELRPGETLGIVGESGSGKSTIGRSVLRLVEAQKGSVVWQGRDLLKLSDEEMRKARRDMQIIFQDPLASLDPRMTVADIIAEPLQIAEPDLTRSERLEEVQKIMSAVGLAPEMVNRYPHEFSGGQAQRIGIARAIITKPKLVVCDEPVSALDVSIQAQIIQLLNRLRAELGLSLIFISHDLSVVRLVCDRVMVLYLGRSLNPALPVTCSTIPSIPILKLCCPRCLCPTRSSPACASASSCKVIRRRLSTRRPAVCSVRDAFMPKTCARPNARLLRAASTWRLAILPEGLADFAAAYAGKRN